MAVGLAGSYGEETQDSPNRQVSREAVGNRAAVICAHCGEAGHTMGKCADKGRDLSPMTRGVEEGG